MFSLGAGGKQVLHFTIHTVEKRQGPVFSTHPEREQESDVLGVVLYVLKTYSPREMIDCT